MLQGDKPMTRAPAYGFGTVADPQLGVERGDVEFDGMLADVELARDHFVGEPASEQAENLALARGERLGELLDGHRRLLEELLYQPFGEHGEALRHGGDGRSQFF